MKTLYKFFSASILIFLMSFSSYGQDDIVSLFDNNNTKKSNWGFYFGPEVKFTKVISMNAVYGGIKCAMLLNRHFAAGLAFGGLLSETDFIGVGSDTTNIGLNSTMVYGGFYLDYITNFPNSPVQISFPTLLGGGGFLLFEKQDPNPNVGGIQDEKMVEGNVYLVFEPSVSLEINLLKKLRMGLGGGYRIVMHSGLERFTNADLSGYTFTVNLKYGIF